MCSLSLLNQENWGGSELTFTPLQGVRIGPKSSPSAGGAGNVSSWADSGGPTYTNVQRNLALELVRVTEAAALASGKWFGKVCHTPCCCHTSPARLLLARRLSLCGSRTASFGKGRVGKRLQFLHPKRLLSRQAPLWSTTQA